MPQSLFQELKEKCSYIYCKKCKNLNNINKMLLDDEVYICEKCNFEEDNPKTLYYDYRKTKNYIKSHKKPFDIIMLLLKIHGYPNEVIYCNYIINEIYKDLIDNDSDCNNIKSSLLMNYLEPL